MFFLPSESVCWEKTNKQVVKYIEFNCLSIKSQVQAVSVFTENTAFVYSKYQDLE